MAAKFRPTNVFRGRGLLARWLHSQSAHNLRAENSSKLSAYVWGAGDGGQLGTSTDAVNTTPQHFPVHTKVSNIGCGHGFTAVSEASNYAASIPRSIDLPVFCEKTRITQIACGRSHALVLTDSEGVFVIGGNSQGQCGFGGVTDKVKSFQHLPLPDATGAIVKVVCGMDHSLLLSCDGKVFSCGWGADGQTGLGFFDDAVKVSQLEGELSGVKIKDISSAVDCCLAVSEDGDVFSWGNSEYAQIGLMSDEKQIATPRRAPLLEGLGKVSKVAAAGSFSVMLLEDGSMYSWGYGVLGHGSDVTFSKEPIRIQAVDDVSERITELYCGLDHAAFTTESGKLFVWGRGGFGRLGLGSDEDQWSPKQVELHGAVKDVSCGVDHMGVIVQESS
ncbi:RCC1-like G exchanging factor-like protein isoform X2 [Nematostella vectensis]|uniref:RCC1-like G exchanging factor-like protein isoform X2 n=1 Tax=Nematostella vectensis TaxID=45351 RepID=UPI00207737EF|nr:RCC1-like G exchanging factor-like protein isoform X2 [Nematostella vectensis]